MGQTAAQQRERLRDKKEKGICQRCSNLVMDGFVYCGHHLKERNARNLAIRTKRLEKRLCAFCGRNEHEINKTNCLECNAKKRKIDRDIKLETIKSYGGKCECCGETLVDFLTIDHIYNDGATHKKELRGNGQVLHRWLKSNGFPKDRYRLLCWNCNAGRHINGGICPHQEAQ